MKTSISSNSNSVNDNFNQFILSNLEMINIRGGGGDPIPVPDHPPVVI